jgi:hypothetical protein
VRCLAHDCPADAEWKLKYRKPSDPNPDGFVLCLYLCEVHVHAEAEPWLRLSAKTRAMFGNDVR